MPAATVIMHADQLLLPRLLGVTRRLDRVPSWNQAALANWPAIVSLIVAIAFGSYGSGILPGRSGSPLSGWGIVPLEAWLIGAALYTAIAVVVVRSPVRDRLLGFPRGAAAEPEPVAAPDEMPVGISAG